MPKIPPHDQINRFDGTDLVTDRFFDRFYDDAISVNVFKLLLVMGVFSLGLVVELKINHRSEGFLIFDNAKRIAQGSVPEFDSSQEPLELSQEFLYPFSSSG